MGLLVAKDCIAGKDSATPSPMLEMPLTPDVFLKDYWQKKPLFMKGAAAKEILTLTRNDLTQQPHSRLIEGKDTEWTLTEDPTHRPSHDTPWTLLVQDCERFDKNANTLKSLFSFFPHWRKDDVMVSYAAPGGSVGAHIDNYDVFLVQGQGTRHWQISNEPLDDPEMLEHDDLQILKTFKTEQEFTAETGDILYLPPRYAHHGVAQTKCLTYSVGFRAPSLNELIYEITGTWGLHLSERDRYTDPDLTPTQHPYLIDERTIERLTTLITPQLQEASQDNIELAFGTLVTQPKRTQPSKELEPEQAHQIVASNAPLPSEHRIATTQNYLFIDGEAYEQEPQIVV